MSYRPLALRVLPAKRAIGRCRETSGEPGASGLRRLPSLVPAKNKAGPTLQIRGRRSAGTQRKAAVSKTPATARTLLQFVRRREGQPQIWWQSNTRPASAQDDEAAPRHHPPRGSGRRAAREARHSTIECGRLDLEGRRGDAHGDALFSFVRATFRCS